MTIEVKTYFAGLGEYQDEVDVCGELVWVGH